MIAHHCYTVDDDHCTEKVERRQSEDERNDKERTLREIRRVLKDDGSLHLLDFGGPAGARHGSRVRGLHSHHRLNDNNEGTILAFMIEAGLTDATKTRDRTMLRGLARIAYYRAGRPLT